MADEKIYPLRNPLLRVLQIIYNIYCCIWFVALMFVVLVLVLLCSVFGKIKGGNVIYVVLRWWATIWYWVCGFFHKEIYEVPLDRTRQFIFVANHISYLDIPAAVRCMHQPMRILGKYEMVKYPVFGIIYRMAVVIVDRRSPERRAQSVRALKAALKNHLSIFIFPEGTFNETGAPLKEFYDGAFRIAIETQTPLKPVLFLDTHERMHYRGIFELTPGKNRAAFLNEIPVAGLTMADVKTLKETCYNAMEAALRRYKKY